jgi:Ca2+-binding RTX toxin-like protein
MYPSASSGDVIIGNDLLTGGSGADVIIGDYAGAVATPCRRDLAVFALRGTVRGATTRWSAGAGAGFLYADSLACCPS